MANAFYNYYLNNLITQATTPVDLSATGDTIKLVMIDHGTVTPDPATHDFYNDISAGAVGGLSTALSSKTAGSVGVGVFDAADLSPAFTSVSGASVESINLLKDTTVATTSDLIAYWDTITGLPLTPNGGDVNVTFNASGIIKV